VTKNPPHNINFLENKSIFVRSYQTLLNGFLSFKDVKDTFSAMEFNTREKQEVWLKKD
jgi:hypothetical protein